MEQQTVQPSRQPSSGTRGTVPPGPATESPADELQRLQGEADAEEASTQRKTGGLASLKADIGALKKASDEVDKANAACDQWFPAYLSHHKELKDYRACMRQFVDGAITEADKSEVESKIAAYKGEVARLRSELVDVESTLVQKNQALIDKRRVATDKESVFTGLRDRTKPIDEWLKRLDALRTRQDGLKAAGKLAELYIVVWHFERELPQHKDVSDCATYRKQLRDAWADLAQARADVRTATEEQAQAQYEVDRRKVRLKVLEDDPIGEVLKAKPAPAPTASTEPAEPVEQPTTVEAGK